MAEEQKQAPPKKNNMLTAIIGVLAGVAILLLAALVIMNQGPGLQIDKAPAEYVVKEKMYQLKDGSYLRLGFSIVVDEDQVSIVRSIIEKEAPGRLPAGITMLLGNKTREELISGTHKREAFARQLKKMLEERVFADYNKKQLSAQDSVEVREVLISEFVTQSG